MRITYTKSNATVKQNSRIERFKCEYPLLWGWKNLLINAAPFIIAWLFLDLTRFSTMLAAYFTMLIYGLRENARAAKRLEYLARKIREQHNG